ncbi:arylesterase [Methylomonas sp. BW4-1]|uniref:Arylesterase n=1 Tax=Methylomonas defluvii TaxID=3045149 RepID=A0ABU4U8L7_9GAMM|nr:MULTISPECIES: arylesterase [unclassified Methylomonas]MDX8125694.1 arylesterase [Methylomonas sp. OY6]PKD42291.1 arylesterase [Methylomonas sp. Kb3]QBC25793.1 arylesterase [Methylomonas sp. LW13]QSB01714.1 arylesterase [Methylomonas sp. EFPC1]
MYSVVLAVILGLLPISAMAKSIVVLGDSISAGYGIEVQLGWVALLQNKLTDLHSGYVISNESISGDTSAGGLARLEQILSRHKPDIVLVELGANDGLRGLSPAEMKNNLTEITRRSQNVGAKVMLLGMKIPPNYGKRYVEMFYEVFPQLSAELKIPYVPFILEEVALNPEMMQADSLHPNELAQPVIAEKIWGYLQALL